MIELSKQSGVREDAKLTGENKKNLLYLVSGPVGVGKSTTSKELARRVEKCILIEGDFILHTFNYGSEASWEDRVRLSWENILLITRNYIQHDYNVVIDFVVEDELEWFRNELSDLEITLRYIVLTAEKEKILERIQTRGDIESLDRSLFLLNKLGTEPLNQPYLFDTTFKQTSEIVDEMIGDTRFICK
ncbi:hypothetical protein E2R51_09295 [Jeotgalibacillus sp. S-D1]|uniref:AAA family ATPase n=1 Tax=Jeotgalibacillus sp. S-D1 TaxID=2552189 RepID=UPI00105A567B|nr:AAA family ATPase [Jeotgalibacillus sp. S-D1]TDL32853.1 hypothetical protein E2R51_09295 [Jeotgalibacillus sp. S-D1]